MFAASPEPGMGLSGACVLLTLFVTPTDYSHRVLPVQGWSLTKVRGGGAMSVLRGELR